MGCLKLNYAYDNDLKISWINKAVRSEKSALKVRSSYLYGHNRQEKSIELNKNTYTAEFWEYDARIVRRWNVDPKPTIGISVYSAFSNNPIFFTDVKGDTTYRFNGKGQYLGMGDLDVAGIRGSVGEYRTYKDAGGKEFQSWIGDKNFNFNDPDVDREQLSSMKVGEIGLHIMSDNNIEWFMNVSNVKNQRYPFWRWGWVANESKEGLIDFSYTFLLPGLGISPKDKYDKKKGGDFKGGFFAFGDYTNAYNINDAGNWLWAQSLSRLDYGAFEAQQMAQANELWGDADSDQRAITSGVTYKPKLKAEARAPLFILNNHVQFKQLSKDAKSDGAEAINKRGNIYGW